MQNYIGLLKDVLVSGVNRQDRTGMGSRFFNGATLKWNLSDGFPMITTRKVSFRIAFEETMFFLRGETDTKKLEDKNINIWKGNTTREFLDNRGLSHLPEGSIGTGYSHAWRNFGGNLGNNDGVDQIRELIDGLRTDPSGRRHIVTAWNPSQNSGTPLPPCHIMHMYSVSENKLNSCFVMRSNDLYLGLPTNIMGYAFLNLAFSKLLNLQPGELTYFGWDAHLYSNQLDVVNQQITREPRQLPSLIFKKDFFTLEELLGLNYEDLEIINYNPHPPLPKVEMAV